MLMKITKWETEDGKVFDTQEDAEDYMFEQEKEVMTQDTEKERALYECISCNHLYGVAPSACDCCENPKNEYREWVALPKEQATPHAPAAPVPQGWKLVPVELLDRATESLGSFVSDHGWGQVDMDTFDDLSALAAAQKPPAAAPVQMPEPVAYLHECGKKPSLRMLEFSKVVIQLSAKGYRSLPLYTEQQVIDLLKSAGVTVKL